jgi:UDPglucose 6-dehydrogenase
LGCVTSACLADLGFQVVGVDDDGRRILGLQQGKPPLYEPGLEDLVRRNLSRGKLEFTTDLRSALRGSPYVLLTYDTPVDESDQTDLTQIWTTVDIVAEHLEPGAVVIVSSQVPVGTCDTIVKRISSVSPQREFGLAYVPENLRLGRALERFMRPAMIVIGADSENTLDRVEAFYSYASSPRLRMDLRSAEMCKHAINAYLATCVSFIGELAHLCDEVGANAMKVSDALFRDERVSPHAPLRPGGLGFAGGTLARDLRALEALGRRLNYPTYLTNAVLQVNEEQKRLVERRLRHLYGSFQGLTIGLLGLTYKPGTSTLRRSVALEIAARLGSLGAKIKAYDPKVSLDELRGSQPFGFCALPEEVAAGGHALVILTEWPEFKDLDYRRLASVMDRPVLIDTKNLLDRDRMCEFGFEYFDIGRGTPSPPHYRLDVPARGVVCE